MQTTSFLCCFNNKLTSLPELKECKQLYYLNCKDNYLHHSEIPNKFISYNIKQYHVNYLVTKIRRFWKRYHYMMILRNSYNENIKYDIVCFI